MPIGDDIRAAGAALLAVDPATRPEEIAEQLNAYLNRFLHERFRALRAHAISSDGGVSPEFLSVVADTNRLNGPLGPEIPAEAMAGVIDIHTMLDLPSFRNSYERIAQAKALPKNEPAREGEFQPTSVTLGVIFARDASLPIETLATELDQFEHMVFFEAWLIAGLVPSFAYLRFQKFQHRQAIRRGRGNIAPIL